MRNLHRNGKKKGKKYEYGLGQCSLCWLKKGAMDDIMYIACVLRDDIDNYRAVKL